MAAAAAMGRAALAVADFLAPPSCALCARHGRGPMCDGCAEKLTRLAAARACGQCAMSLGAGADCPHCAAGRAGTLERIARLGAYEQPLVGLIHEMKYHGNWQLAGELAHRLARQAAVAEVVEAAEVVVAVPLHPLREISRGYNQAELLAARLAERFGKKQVRALRRTRNTASQTGLTALAQRQQNMRGAFALAAPEGIRERRVVLIDDVMTSGATLRAAARALNAASMSAVVLAAADPRHDLQKI